MFGGGTREQDVVAAAFARAPHSTEDALAIVPQDLEAVIHWHREPYAVLHRPQAIAAARHSIKRYIRPRSSGRMRCESDLNQTSPRLPPQQKRVRQDTRRRPRRHWRGRRDAMGGAFKLRRLHPASGQAPLRPFRRRRYPAWSLMKRWVNRASELF